MFISTCLATVTLTDTWSELDADQNLKHWIQFLKRDVFCVFEKKTMHWYQKLVCCWNLMSFLLSQACAFCAKEPYKFRRPTAKGLCLRDIVDRYWYLIKLILYRYWYIWLLVCGVKNLLWRRMRGGKAQRLWRRVGWNLCFLNGHDPLAVLEMTRDHDINFVCVY